MIDKVDMNGVTGYSERESLPLGSGGYVLRIMGAEVKINSVGKYIELSCDIAEGEYKDFYTRDYKAQSGDNKKWHCVKFINLPKDDGTERDGWTKQAFKTFLDALEGSNAGYHFDWDEGKFKNKLIGGLFRTEEYLGKYDNEIHEAVRLASFTTAEKVRKGSFRPLKAKKLKGDAYEPAKPAFVEVDSDELPF